MCVSFKYEKYDLREILCERDLILIIFLLGVELVNFKFEYTRDFVASQFFVYK